MSNTSLSSITEENEVQHELPERWQPGEGLPALDRAKMLLCIMRGGAQMWQDWDVDSKEVDPSSSEASLPDTTDNDEESSDESRPKGGQEAGSSAEVRPTRGQEAGSSIDTYKDTLCKAISVYDASTTDTLPRIRTIGTLPTMDRLPTLDRLPGLRGASYTLESLPDKEDLGFDKNDDTDIQSMIHTLENLPDMADTGVGKAWLSMENPPELGDVCTPPAPESLPTKFRGIRTFKSSPPMDRALS